MINMLSLCLLISVLFQAVVPSFFIPAAYADFAEDYPEWETEYAQLILLADGENSGMVKGVRPGQFIRLFDNTEALIAYNGHESSGFIVSGDDLSYSEEGYCLNGIGPGFSVEVFPDSEAVLYQDADLFQWKKWFLPCDISAEEESFSVSPSTALDGSFNGSVSLPAETAGENVYRLEVLMESGELLTGENSVGGLAPGDYKVRVAPEKNILASEWYVFTVEGPAKYQITIEDVPVEEGSVEAYYVVPGDDSSRVPLSSGSEIYEGITVYVSVTAAENYELVGIDLAPDGGTSERLLPEEAEDGVFSFDMPASSVIVSAEFSARQPDPPIEEDPPGDGDDTGDPPGDGDDTDDPPDDRDNTDDPPDEESDEEDNPDEDEDSSNSIMAVIFAKKEDTVFLSAGERFYYYTLIPEDPDGTLHWSRTSPDVAGIMIDPDQRVISVTPKKAGSFTLTAVVKENEEISDSLTVTVIDDRPGNPETFDSCYFTYATEEGMWFYDLPGAFSLRCSAPASMLDKVLVDGRMIPQYNSGYLNWSLSDSNDTAVNFSSEFMSSLFHGDHTFTFVYTNGVSASKSVSIQSRYSQPKTGDEQNLFFFCVLLTFSVLMTAEIFMKIRKEK